MRKCVVLSFELYIFIFSMAAYFNDIAVGAVCCRVDHSQNQKRLYIMTLGCLAPYRRLGIGKIICVFFLICVKKHKYIITVSDPLSHYRFFWEYWERVTELFKVENNLIC